MGCQSSCQQNSRQLETRCGRESHTRPRGPSENPDGVDPSIRRTKKTQRDGHNIGVKIWSLYSVSSCLSHANFEQPFRNIAIKWEVNIIVKKSSSFLSSCVLHSCVHPSCVLYSCVCRLSCVCYHCVGMYPVYICIFLHGSADEYATNRYHTEIITGFLHSILVTYLIMLSVKQGNMRYHFWVFEHWSPEQLVNTLPTRKISRLK